MSRTLTAPPTDKGIWRSLLRLVHPDAYGDHDLFIWTRAVYEHVAGDAPEEAPPHVRREPPKHHARTTPSDRVNFDGVFDRFASHEALTRHAIRMAEEVGEPYASLLRLLNDCYEAVPHDTVQVAGLRRPPFGHEHRRARSLVSHSGEHPALSAPHRPHPEPDRTGGGVSEAAIMLLVNNACRLKQYGPMAVCTSHRRRESGSGNGPGVY